MTRSWLLPVFALLLTGCGLGKGDEPAVDPANQWPQYLCGPHAFDLTNVRGSHPAHTNGRASSGDVCWTLEYKEDPNTLSGPVRLQREFGKTPDGKSYGCEFRGKSSQVRAELTEGGCLIQLPETHGYLRFVLSEPAAFMPRGGAGSLLRVTGEYFEWRGGDMIQGTAILGILPTTQSIHAGKPGYPERATFVDLADSWPACGAPKCFRVDFAGKGRLVEGSDPPCRSVLAWHDKPFSVQIDKRGFLAFADAPDKVKPEDWLRGGPAFEICGSSAWTGQRAGNNNFYRLAWPAGAKPEMQMNQTQLHTENGVTGLCHTEWKTEAVPCN